MDRNNPVIKTLLQSDEEFKQLYAEHELLESRLAEFDSLHYLNSEQEMQRKTLQKTKLRGRDRMEQIIRQSASGAEHA